MIIIEEIATEEEIRVKCRDCEPDIILNYKGKRLDEIRYPVRNKNKEYVLIFK